MASFLAGVRQIAVQLGLNTRCYHQLPGRASLPLAAIYIQTRNVNSRSHGGWLGARASDLSVSKPLPQSSSGCPICSRNITFTYKDVLFLSQFLSPEGYLLNRRNTGVCKKQQRKLEKHVKISRRLGLLPHCGPLTVDNSNS